MTRDDIGGSLITKKARRVLKKLFSFNSQADTDLLMCVSEESESGRYYAKNQNTPTMTTEVSIFVRSPHSWKTN